MKKISYSQDVDVLLIELSTDAIVTQIIEQVNDLPEIKGELA